MGIYYRIWIENHESNKDKLEKKQIKMMLSEESADDIKIKLIQKYAEAGTHGLGGFLMLILRMDKVINFVLEYVRKINIISIS